jgi:hypothetical protein
MGSYGYKNQSILQAKSENKPYSPTLSNGDTVKQLLARSRYLLHKSRGKWTVNQKKEPSCYLSYILIKTAHALSQQLRNLRYR